MVQKAGGQWTPKVETYPLSVLSIGFAPNGTGVATGNMGLLLEMQPNSNDWVRHKYNATNRLFSVAASPANEFLVSGAYGTLLDRPPNGAWKVIPLGFTGMAIPNLYAVHFLDARKAVIAGESGTIVTLDSGKITKSAAVRESLFAVTSCGGMITAGGQSGMIETSEDGLVWHPSRIPGNPDLYGFGCLPDGRLVASSSWMYMVGTRQGAAWTWQEIRPPGDIPWFQAILPTDSSNVLISGQGGIWQTGLTNGAK
jgi:photosystem II stability/assembly factor-like uncharacterized protein